MAIKEEGHERKNLTRPTLLKMAATGVGATTMFAAFNPPEVMGKIPKKWDMEGLG